MKESRRGGGIHSGKPNPFPQTSKTEDGAVARIIWTEPALQDIDAIADYISLDKPDVARRLPRSTRICTSGATCTTSPERLSASCTQGHSISSFSHSTVLYSFIDTRKMPFISFISCGLRGEIRANRADEPQSQCLREFTRT